MKLAEGFNPIKKDMDSIMTKMRNISFVHLPLLLASAPAYAADLGDVPADGFPDYSKIF